MHKWMMAGVFSALATMALAQSHALPPGHVDRYAGELIVRAGVSGGRNYAGVYMVAQRLWFVYQVEDPVSFDEIRTHGTIEYWHDGFRVTLPREGRALIFRRSETTLPPSLSRSRFSTTQFDEGFGVVFIQRPHARAGAADGSFTIPEYCSPEYPSCGPFDEDPVGDGGGGTAP